MSRLISDSGIISPAVIENSVYGNPCRRKDSNNISMQPEKSATLQICEGTQKRYDSHVADSAINCSGNSLHTSLMQTSPPPHGYRHLRGYRNFKNPPQPHMCIRTATESGEELFINVLSWTRIVIPLEPTDPIPLYGGMRVPPGSPRSPPIAFAVMANPEVLKDAGRHSKDPEERKAMVELMCDFVEAMNPGVKLIRNAVILKDRDISGELKDVWNAVQVQRDREREEQMVQQRQQHVHNITTQQLLPKPLEGKAISNNGGSSQMASKMTPDNKNEGFKAMKDKSLLLESEIQSNLEYNPEFSGNGNISTITFKETGDKHSKNSANESKCDVYDYSLDKSTDGNDQIDAANCLRSIRRVDGNMEGSLQRTSNSHLLIQKDVIKNNESKINCHSLSETVIGNTVIGSTPITAYNSITTTTLVTSIASAPTSTKKDKLVGFLPNGYIFPRFKNNKSKEKEKEGKTKDKERTLLNVLKRNKDTKVLSIENDEKEVIGTDPQFIYENNCIALASEVEKLDLNKIERPSSGGNVFVKLKITTSPTAVNKHAL